MITITKYPFFKYNPWKISLGHFGVLFFVHIDVFERSSHSCTIHTQTHFAINPSILDAFPKD